MLFDSMFESAPRLYSQKPAVEQCLWAVSVALMVESVSAREFFLKSKPVQRQAFCCARNLDRKILLKIDAV